MDKTILQTIGVVFGVILAVPVIYALITFTSFLKDIKNLAENTATSLKTSIEEIHKILSGHDQEITAHGEYIAVMKDRDRRIWNGDERRSGEDRRKDA